MNDNSEANVALIAAAPELLAALEWFVRKQNYHNDGGDGGRELDTYEIAEKFLDMAEALIAKATGT